MGGGGLESHLSQKECELLREEGWARCLRACVEASAPCTPKPGPIGGSEMTADRSCHMTYVQGGARVPWQVRLCCEWRHVQLVSFLKVCTLGCPDVFMGISTQANGRETAHSEEAWWAASSLVQPVPIVLILSPVAKAGLCVPPQGWSGKFIVKTHGKGQGRTPPESWGDCLRQGLDLLGSSGSTDQPLKDNDRGVLGRVACPHLPRR